jgi:hypothetical protein
MVNRNYFQFNSKNFFYFWKTIYGFENRKSFFGFKLFIFIRTFVRIRYHRTFEFVGSSNLPPKVPNFGIRLSKSDGSRRIPAKISCQNPETFGSRRRIPMNQIQANIAGVQPDSGHTTRVRPY